MLTTPHTHRTWRRALAAAATLALGACATMTETPPEPIVASEPEVVIDITPPPAPEPVPVVTRAVERHEVVILLDEATAAQSEVAQQIAELLPAKQYRVALADVRESSTPDALAALRGRPKLLAVAVGLEAATFARERLSGPVVFCQVFNYQELIEGGGRVWGVHSMPPLAAQLQSWKELDPSLRRIGLIVSEEYRALADEAVQAAAQFDVQIRYEISSSDRETLYLSKRLAAEVDGLWLLPDNRILSPTVLQELLGYALSHEVGVLVFNESLLPWGALLSAKSTTADVARTVRAVLERVATGRTQNLPVVTPLSEIELRVNEEVAAKLKLVRAAAAPPVPHVAVR